MLQPCLTACREPYLREMQTRSWIVLGMLKDQKQQLSLIQDLNAVGFMVFELQGYVPGRTFHGADQDENHLFRCLFAAAAGPRSLEQLRAEALALCRGQAGLIVGNKISLEVVSCSSGEVLETKSTSPESLSEAFARHVLGTSELVELVGFRQFDGIFSKWGAAKCGLQIPRVCEQVTRIEGRWMG